MLDIILKNDLHIYIKLLLSYIHEFRAQNCNDYQYNRKQKNTTTHQKPSHLLTTKKGSLNFSLEHHKNITLQ